MPVVLLREKKIGYQEQKAAQLTGGILFLPNILLHFEMDQEKTRQENSKTP